MHYNMSIIPVYNAISVWNTSESMISISIKIIILTFTAVLSVFCVYDVPSYYGHFSRNYFLPDRLSQGVFKYFEYHYAVDMDSSNQTIYFANTAKHCIERYHIPTKTLSVLAGICGTSGDRVGGLNVMLLKNPMSVAFYQPNTQSSDSQDQMKIVIVANSTCSLSSQGCILSSSEMNNKTLSMDNLRASPPVLQFPPISQNQTQYLYVSDTENHCIKKLDLLLQTSTVVAGLCGEKGFLDGPIGFNKLNRPTNLGVTRTGDVYFYDLGNQYMRKLATTGQVITLLNGACKFFGNSRQVSGYWLKNILCYDSWVEFETEAPTQHIIDPSDINICLEHSSKC